MLSIHQSFILKDIDSMLRDTFLSVRHVFWLLIPEMYSSVIVIDQSMAALP